MNRLSRIGVATTAVLAVSASLAACSDTSSSEDEKIDKVSIIVPADPGGGWDQTGRALSKVLTDNDLVGSAAVTNVPGAGGTVGLAQLANSKDPDTLMMMGLVMIGAIDTNKSTTTLADTTPIAELTEEQEIIVVPADSKYKSINELLEDIKANGQDVVVTGGSAGGTDQILAGLLLKAAGVEGADIPKTLNYVPNSGGGESLAGLLGGKVDVGISGVGEYADQVKAGKLRALAVSGAEASPLLPDVPTLTDEGVDLVLTNWRGIVAPGDLDDAKADALTELVSDAVETDDWKKALADNAWDDAFKPGDEFATFIDGEVESVHSVLVDIGLVK